MQSNQNVRLEAYRSSIELVSSEIDLRISPEPLTKLSVIFSGSNIRSIVGYYIDDMCLETMIEDISNSDANSILAKELEVRIKMISRLMEDKPYLRNRLFLITKFNCDIPYDVAYGAESTPSMYKDEIAMTKFMEVVRDNAPGYCDSDYIAIPLFGTVTNEKTELSKYDLDPFTIRSRICIGNPIQGNSHYTYYSVFGFNTLEEYSIGNNYDEALYYFDPNGSDLLNSEYDGLR